MNEQVLDKLRQIKVLGLTAKTGAGKVFFPSDHQPGVRVPKGGSSCANCEYLGKDGKSCDNRYFIIWNGGKELPAPADEFCSDWWMEKASVEKLKDAES